MYVALGKGSFLSNSVDVAEEGKPLSCLKKNLNLLIFVLDFFLNYIKPWIYPALYFMWFSLVMV